jgi:TRAP-type C4-dicarboxylate transport system substrate-binding protein
MTRRLSRRSLIAGATAGSAAVIVRPLRAADYKFAQYHNQAADGTLHKNLVAMWAAVRAQTNGRVETEVFAENNKLAGGDPVALKMLMAGEIQFFTLMGGIIGTVVPVAEAQQVPFAFKSARMPTGRSTGRSAATSARRWRRKACIYSRSAGSITACGRWRPFRAPSRPRLTSTA